MGGRRQQTGYKTLRTGHTSQRSDHVDVPTYAFNKDTSYGIQRLWCCGKRIVMEDFLKNSTVRYVPIQTPGFTDSHLAEHSANCRQVKRSVNIVRFKQGSVDVENDSVHLRWR